MDRCSEAQSAYSKVWAPDQVSSPVGEDQLRILGRSLRSFFERFSSDQLQELSSLLFDTAASPELSPSHRIAAFNALCGFVDQCLSHKDPKAQAISKDSNLCLKLLNIYLHRYEYSRQKSMKQLLEGVTRAIGRQPRGTGSGIRSEPVRILLDIICGESNVVTAKPAFHVLYALLQKQVIDSSEILAILGDMPGSTSRGASSLVLAEQFLTMLLAWSCKTEFAPIIGSIIPAFLKSFIQFPLLHYNTNIWSSALLQTIAKHPGSLPAVRIYVLPGILELDRSQYWKFLLQLGLYSTFGIEQNDGDFRTSAKENSSLHAEILFASLQIGKTIGFVELTDAAICSSILYGEQNIQICDRLVGSLLGDSDLATRLAGLSLLISAKQQSQPLTKACLKELKQYIPLSFLEPDANFRGELLSLIQNLIERIKSICTVQNRAAQQCRKISQIHGSNVAETVVRIHQDFLQWLCQTSTGQLHSSASYQRHFTSLKIIHMLLRSGLDLSISSNDLAKQAKSDLNWTFSFPVMTGALRRALMDALLDPFEDVRQLSASILKLVNAPAIPSETLSIHKEQIEQYNELLDDGSLLATYQIAQARARGTMLRSGRIDHADGYARFSDVCFYFLARNASEQIQRQILHSSINTQSQDMLLSSYSESVSLITDSIEIAKTDLNKAVEQYPIHGLLTSLRYIIENLAARPEACEIILEGTPCVCQNLEFLVREVWNCVRATLCNDAPEGFLPEEAEEEISISTRDLLSYCWRALKDSSLLLRSIVENIALLWPSADHRRSLGYFGGLCFEQLAELRHRGAFSTVAQSFTVVCMQCKYSKDPTIQGLRMSWYKAVLELIQAQGAKITRRSAGIPAAMVAVLASGIDFSNAVDDLQLIIAKDTDKSKSERTDLPQVHAFNCLRAMFASTKLVAESEPHIVKVMGLAANALSADKWPVRNCGLMLFRGLIDRLLGSHESFDSAFAATMGSRLAYERHPGLLALLTELLERSSLSQLGEQEMSPESLFPALDLLRRAPPPTNASTEMQRHILKASGSPEWHIREAAAKAFAALSRGSLECISKLQEGLMTDTENFVHGKLLCMRHVVLAALHYEKDKNKQIQLLQILARHLDVVVGLIHSSRPRSLVNLKILLQIHVTLCSSLLQHCSDQAIPRLDPASELSAVHKVTKQTLHDTLTKIVENVDVTQLCIGEASLHAYISLGRICNLLVEDNASTGSAAAELSMILAKHDAEGLDFILASMLDLFAIDKTTTMENLTLLAKALVFGGGAAQENGRPANLDLVQQSRAEAYTRSILARVHQQLHVIPISYLSTMRDFLTGLDLPNACFQSTTPFAFQSALELWGVSLGIELEARGELPGNFLATCTAWCNFVRAALSEDNEFPLRMAAVKSLYGLRNVLERGNLLPKNLEISVYMAVYAALVDDDDEIRGIGSVLVTRIISRTMRQNCRVMSAAVSSRLLCQHLISKYRTSTTLIQEAINRMISRTFAVMPNSKDAEEQLKESLEEDAALFVVERQNLYIDPVSEASIWSKVLKRVSADAITARSTAQLCRWALEGLQALLSHAGQQEDGPLGWASKNEVFALGMQIFAAADVVLEWRRKSPVVRIKASKIRMLLARFIKVAPSARLHEFWVQRAEQILLDSIQTRVSLIAGNLHKVQLHLARA